MRIPSIGRNWVRNALPRKHRAVISRPLAPGPVIVDRALYYCQVARNSSRGRTAFERLHNEQTASTNIRLVDMTYVNVDPPPDVVGCSIESIMQRRKLGQGSKLPTEREL